VAAGAEPLADGLEGAGLSTLASLVRMVDVEQLLPEGEEFTFIAPGDDALRSLDPDDLQELLSDPAQVLDVLRNHVVEERLTAADLEERDEVVTAAGETVPVSVAGATVSVGEATVVDGPFDVADRGIVHVVDAILLPAGVGS
jgi:uncharacterized surface protein with fasciclin (FAS1) repeats